MADEKWNQIFGPGGAQGRMPFQPRLEIPRVTKPQCPEHCSGRHQTDGVMQCPHCKVPAYRVVLHEWFHMEGHYFNSMEPMNGAAAVARSETPVCNCGRKMTRVFAR